VEDIQSLDRNLLVDLLAAVDSPEERHHIGFVGHHIVLAVRRIVLEVLHIVLEVLHIVPGVLRTVLVVLRTALEAHIVLEQVRLQ